MALFQPRAYNNRGVAKCAKGDFEGAITDYNKSIDSDKDKADYARFFLSLTLRRLHRDDSPAGLTQAVAKWKDGWPKTVGCYLIGKLPEADFLAQADNGDAKTAREHRCEAYYYTGMTHLLANDPAIAKNFFEKCLATKISNFEEFHLASDELTRFPDKH
jgi:lipoprotein NlpI